MGLTAAEKKELAALEKELGQPKGGLTPEEQLELEQLESELEPGLGSQALDYTLRALDYPAGYARGAVGALAGQSREGDLERVVKGQAPSTSEYMERAQIPEGAKLSDAIPRIYSKTGGGLPLEKGGPLDPTVRGVTGFAGDVALDPLTYLTLGTASAAKNAGLLAKLKKPLTPIKTLEVPVGKSIYASGLKDVTQEGVKKGKTEVADTMLKYNISGSAKQMSKQVEDTAGALLTERDSLLKAADEAGAEVNMSKAMSGMKKEAEKMILSGDPQLQDIAKAFLEKAKEYEMLDAKTIKIPTGEQAQIGTKMAETGRLDMSNPYSPKPELKEVPVMGDMMTDQIIPGVSPSRASGFKTSLYQGLPNSQFDIAAKTKPGGKLQEKMAIGIKNEIEKTADKIQDGLGDQIRQRNKELGDLLTIRKASMNAAKKEGNKNVVTAIDAALAAAAPQVYASKKAADIAKTAWVRTKAGKNLYKAGNLSKGEQDILARRMGIWTNMKEEK